MKTSLLTPPAEDDIKSSGTRRRNLSSSKSTKHARSTHSHSHPRPSIHDTHSKHSMADGRHEKVWRACERCRMKKTKCDGECPCRRCKNDGLVCTVAKRKKTVDKQLPRGYAEVLENTQFTLTATVHKLYVMVRNGESWSLGEPNINDRGKPVVHDIASKLGCIRHDSDIDLPIQSVFPEDEAGLAELAARLDALQRERERGAATVARSKADLTRSNLTDQANNSAELDHSDSEQNFCHGSNNKNTNHSPQSLSYDIFRSHPAPSEDTSPTMSPTAPATTSYLSLLTRPTTLDFNAQQFVPQAASFIDMNMINQGPESEFGIIQPHMLSCPTPKAMMGAGERIHRDMIREMGTESRDLDLEDLW